MHITSDFQRYYSDGLMQVFKDIAFVPELRIGNKRIDLGTQDGEYGIEIKSCHADLKSGYGLNQEEFEYGYVACPKDLVCYAIGWLYVNGMEKTGVLMLEKNAVSLIKPAVWNYEKCRIKPFPVTKQYYTDKITQILCDE